MRAGALDRRVTFQKKVSGTDSWGQPIDTWEDVATVWAWVKAPSGMGSLTSEYMADSGEVSAAQYSVRIRYREDLTHDMRMLDAQGRLYDIRQVTPDVAGREFTDIVVAAGANNG